MTKKAIPDINGGESEFTKKYRYYRIVDSNGDSGWINLSNEFTFNVGYNFDIRTSDGLGRNHTYERIGNTEKLKKGDVEGWKNLYSINGQGKIAIWTLKVGTVIQTTDLVAVYTNVTQYFPDHFFYE